MGRLDSLGMDFSDLYALERGDLIYGLSGKRDVYRNHYHQETGLEIEQNSWWSLDQYNNTLGISAPMVSVEQLDIMIDYDRLHPTQNTQRVFHGDLLQKMVGTHRRDPHDIFRIEKQQLIAKEGIPSPSGDEMMTEDQPYRSAVSWKAIRRACKFGIEYVVAKHARFGTIIHFILDGLEDKDILTKKKFRNQQTGREAVPITTSELRNAFRKWHLPNFNESIYFYKNFTHVRAPWETNPEAWQKYAESRLDKYKNQLAQLMQTNTGYPYRMEVQPLLFAATAAERQGSRSIAVDALRNAVELLEDFKAGRKQPTQVNQITGLSGRSLSSHVRNALDKYSRRGFFSRQDKRTKKALPHLRRLVQQNVGDSLLKALHWYLEIEPNNRMVLGKNLSDRLSRTGRLSTLLEKEYMSWRFNLRQ